VTRPFFRSRAEPHGFSCSRGDPRGWTWPVLCLSFVLAACGVFLLAACGGGAPSSAANAPVPIERLYPLRAGSIWTYDVDTGEGVPVLAITRVLSAAPERIEVSSGSDPLLYQQRPEGLYRTDLGIYVLRAPIQKGASWDQSGARAEVTDVQKSLSTVAGEFHGCVEVLEQGGASQKHVRTVFCPDVGPVEIESTTTISLTGKTTRVLARLRGYDFSGAAAQ
jgi:hypothetical protein